VVIDGVERFVVAHDEQQVTVAQKRVKRRWCARWQFSRIAEIAYREGVMSGLFRLRGKVGQCLAVKLSRWV